MNSQDSTRSSSSRPLHQPKQVEDIVVENSDGFEVKWDEIEANVQKSYISKYGRRHHRHHREHRRRYLDDLDTTATNTIPPASGTKLKHTVNIVEKPEKKKSILPKIIIGFVIFIFCIIIGLGITYWLLQENGKKELFNSEDIYIETIDGAESQNRGHIITYKDKTYHFNPYVTSILFMGVDTKEMDLVDDIHGTGGQADAIYLLTYDSSTGKVKILSFSRDTVVDINQYTVDGDYAGVTEAQLCLAYAYGDGKHLSAENVITSLQRIIYNIPINSYFAMNLEAIGVVNDDIGGVTLTSLFTFQDFVEGETITLKGKQAEYYLRARDVNILDSNVNRTQRQQQYITAFANQLVPAVKNDLTLPIDLYNHAKDYVVTNLTPAKITFLASSAARSYDGIEIVSVPGTIKANPNDGKAEFYPDSDKLYEILLETFYVEE